LKAIAGALNRALQFLACIALSGCGTLPSGRGWGQDVTAAPGWSRVRTAAIEAAGDPWVWLPLAGAAGLQIDRWDRRVSDWARRETPVFGSQANAASWSDDLRTAAAVADLTTMLLTPSGGNGRTWVSNKLKGSAVDLAALSAATATTRALKTSTGRTRPSGVDTESFPSGHVSSAATHDRLAARNLDWIPISAGTRRVLDYGLNAVTLGTAWARIEAAAHYPSDTLFSIALGNFSANFFQRAFLGVGGSLRPQIAVSPAPGGVMLYWQLGM
jgi:membrane-associated phospholipid phosphatase